MRPRFVVFETVGAWPSYARTELRAAFVRPAAAAADKSFSKPAEAGIKCAC